MSGAGQLSTGITLDTNFIDVLWMSENDLQPGAIVMIGEIGVALKEKTTW